MTLALPLFFIAGTTQSFLALVWFMLWVVGLSTLFTWVYNNTVGSLLIPVLLHASVNFFAAILTVLPANESDSTRPFLRYTLLECPLAGGIALLNGPRLSGKTRPRAAAP